MRPPTHIGKFSAVAEPESKAPGQTHTVRVQHYEQHLHRLDH